LNEESPTVRGFSKKTLILIVIAIAGVTAVLAYWFLSMPPRYPWLFKGAYADYQGETTLLFVPVKVKVHMEILDLNSTHVQLLIHYKIESIFTNESSKIEWVKIEDAEKEQTHISNENDHSLTRIYEEQLYLESVGLRECTVYEYTNNETIRYYIDKKTGWLISMRMTSSASTFFNSTVTFNINIDITNTNIPDLKK